MHHAIATDARAHAHTYLHTVPYPWPNHPQDREWRADELVKDYEKDLQLRQYVPIIRNEPRYPIIRDAKGVVLSMPPIINGWFIILMMLLLVS